MASTKITVENRTAIPIYALLTFAGAHVGGASRMHGTFQICRAPGRSGPHRNASGASGWGPSAVSRATSGPSTPPRCRKAGRVEQAECGNSGNSTISGGATAASDPVENKSDPTK